MRFYNASFLVGVLTALAITPATALASVTVTTAGGEMTITGDNAADNVTVRYTFFGQPPISGDGASVSNPAGVVPGPGCVPQSPTLAVCPEPDQSIIATLGGGADRFISDDYLLASVEVSGEGDNDVLGPAGAILDGGEGDDTLLSSGFGAGQLTGGPGNDVAKTSGFEGYFAIGNGGFGGNRVDGDVERVEGSEYDDSFSITPGAHPNLVIAAGGGSDFVSYFAQGGGITATLDDAANDGPGSGQNLIDVESLEGGGGADTLTGNGESNILYGSGGNDRLNAGGDSDTLSGGSGNDSLEGGDDSDTLDGGSGADTLRGQAGDDTVSYEDQTGPVTVSLDGTANDGASGEGDDIGPDFEKVFGSTGDDTITGGAGNEEIAGGAGADRIDGGGGADKIRGNAGDDIIKGGAGADELRGNAGDDTIDAGPGEDTVSGQDREDGGEDIDTLELRDQEKDVAACTGGITRVFADQLDIVAATCLTERSGPPAPPVAQPPVAGPPPAPTGPALRVRRQGVKVDRRGVARIRVSCPRGTAPCAGVLRLVAVSRKKPVIVATLVYAIPGGKARTLRVRLNKRGRALFRARRRVMRVDVTVAARDRGAPQSKVQAVKLRRG